MTNKDTASEQVLPIKTLDEAHQYLTAWMRAHFPTDRTFDRYISERLAGDFAWQLANALALQAAPEAPATTASASGSHHLTPESIEALIADLKACEEGTEVPSIFDRDWRTRCGVIHRVIEHLREIPAVMTASVRCEECVGTGKIGPDDNPGEMDCEVCNGTGRADTTASASLGSNHDIADRLSLWLSSSLNDHLRQDEYRKHIRAWLEFAGNGDSLRAPAPTPAIDAALQPVKRHLGISEAAWFHKLSEYGPWIECNPSAPGAVRFFSRHEQMTAAYIAALANKNGESHE